MPRTARASVADVCYHVINRGNGQRSVFHADADYAAFLKLLAEAKEHIPMRLLAYCLMPSHIHLVVRPVGDGDLGRWMQWLLTSHVRRYHRHYQTSGHVWQGRFKAFPVQEDDHLLTVIRYVERNPVRAAGLDVSMAEYWPWSSAGRPPGWVTRPTIDPWPVARASDWLDWVNRPLTTSEEQAIRQSVKRSCPFGQALWREETAARLGLEATLRPRGRPRKNQPAPKK